MGMIANDDRHPAADAQQAEIRTKVLAGLEDIHAGRTKDLNEVCDRLEQRYRDAAI